MWTSANTLKSRLGLLSEAATVYEESVTAILQGVESVIENMISSPVTQDTTARTEYYDGVVGQVLKLRFRPVVKADLKVYVDELGAYGDGAGTPFAAATEWVLGTDFDLLDVRGGYSKSANLICLNGIWPTTWYRPPTRLASTLAGQRGAIKVIYKAGWAANDIPPALKEAAYLEATTLFSMSVSRGGSPVNGLLKQSESLNGYSYSLGAASGLDVSGYGASRLTNPTAMAMLGGLGLIDPAFA